VSLTPILVSRKSEAKLKPQDDSSPVTCHPEVILTNDQNDAMTDEVMMNDQKGNHLNEGAQGCRV
jgi:hypothetical protein